MKKEVAVNGLTPGAVVKIIKLIIKGFRKVPFTGFL